MKDENLESVVWAQAFYETLNEYASHALCERCSCLMESEALKRYRMMLAKRREQLAALETKIEQETQRDSHRRGKEHNE